MPPNIAGFFNARAFLRACGTILFLLALVCASAALFVPHAAYADNTGLVGYWSFDEGIGTKATDFSGNGYIGTLAGNAAWINGKRGKALSFDGDNDHVHVKDWFPSGIHPAASRTNG